MGALRMVRMLHTVVWAFFVSCIFAIPVFAWRGNYGRALLFIGVVFIEVLIVVSNGWRCPLTSIAARYTNERRDNFDIYLPELLARHNKLIFGVLYLAGVIFTFVRWVSSTATE
jgi:hypothetical protein